MFAPFFAAKPVAKEAEGERPLSRILTGFSGYTAGHDGATGAMADGPTVWMDAPSTGAIVVPKDITSHAGVDRDWASI